MWQWFIDWDTWMNLATYQFVRTVAISNCTFIWFLLHIIGWISACNLYHCHYGNVINKLICIHSYTEPCGHTARLHATSYTPISMVRCELLLHVTSIDFDVRKESSEDDLSRVLSRQVVSGGMWKTIILLFTIHLEEQYTVVHTHCMHPSANVNDYCCGHLSWERVSIELDGMRTSHALKGCMREHYARSRACTVRPYFDQKGAFLPKPQPILHHTQHR